MITSKSNELVKHIKSLYQKKYRDEFFEYIVEGEKMVLEALENDVEIKKIVICNELFNKEISFNNIEYVDKKTYEYISDTETPQGIMAILSQKKSSSINKEIVFALDDVQDPGNLGTIMRSLDAAGISELLLSKMCADQYNPKVIRSTMGAIYRININKTDNLKESLLELKSKGYNIIVTSLNTDKYLYDIDFKQKSVVVIGNESRGVSEEIAYIATNKIKIPMLGKTESLNAGVATSIVAYEIVRQNFNK